MVGRFCTASDLAGAGVAISLFNVISRTFNFLSSATTSLSVFLRVGWCLHVLETDRSRSRNHRYNFHFRVVDRN